MATYRMADPEADELVRELLGKHYKQLAEAEVKVQCLFAFAGESGGPALKHHGYPAAAVVKVTSLKERVAGLGDCTVTVDGDAWKEWEEGRKRAVLDHELYHLELQLDEKGAVKTDDAYRPKLKLKPHDWQLGGFAAIAKRYDAAAPEVEMVRDTMRKWGQMLLPF